MSLVSMMSHQQQCTAAMGSTTAKQSRKRLGFQLAIAVQSIDCRMTEEEKARSYYSKDELNTISLEVKAIHALSKELQNPSSTCSAYATERDCMLGLRGLELYLFPIRVRNKALARKALLKYHRKLDTEPNKTIEEKHQSLAAASAKLSQWSKLVAMETARLDSLKAYEGDYLIPINEPVDITPFPGTRKRRRVSFNEDSQPTKRRRSHEMSTELAQVNTNVAKGGDSDVVIQMEVTDNGMELDDGGPVTMEMATKKNGNFHIGGHRYTIKTPGRSTDTSRGAISIVLGTVK